MINKKVKEKQLSVDMVSAEISITAPKVVA